MAKNQILTTKIAKFLQTTALHFLTQVEPQVHLKEQCLVTKISTPFYLLWAITLLSFFKQILIYHFCLYLMFFRE